jgi:DnaJ-domain-containing protein 1
VSITKRILEGAQSGLSKLTSLVIVDDEPLTNVESAALSAELVARRAHREKLPRKPTDNPVARLASSAPDAIAARKRQAAERAGVVKRERAQREATERRQADEAFRRMKAQAATGGGSASSYSSASGSASSSSSSSSSGRPPRPGSTDAQVAEWYKVLDLPPGSDMAAIKTSYRKLMRKYHPDMHAASPQKQKAANELSLRVTAAYNGLTAYLEK